MSDRPLTGWHVLAIFSGCFAVIISVNLVLAFQAVATFPGLEVKNSYVASQSFDAERAAQDALGWTLTTEARPDRLRLAITDASGAPVEPRVLAATLGRATHTGQDQTPDLAWTGSALEAPVSLVPGYWNLRLKLEAPDGTLFQRRLQLSVRDAG